MRLAKPEGPQDPPPSAAMVAAPVPVTTSGPLRVDDGQGLDQLMLAMDVVDTLRHQQDLVDHALAEDERDAALVARIRSIYASQGIEVTDAVVREGVEALKKDRFVYVPPAETFSLRLARIYVDRGRWTRRVLAVAALGLAGWLAFAVPAWLERGETARGVRTEVAELRTRLVAAGERSRELRAALSTVPVPPGLANVAQPLRGQLEAELGRADQALLRANGAVASGLAGADIAAMEPAAITQALLPVRAPLAEAEQALERAQAGATDLADLGGLAQSLQRTRAILAGATLAPAARSQIEATDQQAQQALAAGDLALARGRIDRLADLALAVDLAYELRIVSRPDRQSGVWRHPADNPRARNHYVIVDAVGADGRPVLLPITSEEDQSVRQVSTFGVRVPQAVYDAVRADKQDNGLVDNPLVAIKRRGELEPSYRMPVAGGYITDW
jgi:hypothetical protein